MASKFVSVARSNMRSRNSRTPLLMLFESASACPRASKLNSVVRICKTATVTVILDSHTSSHHNCRSSSNQGFQGPAVLFPLGTKPAALSVVSFKLITRSKKVAWYEDQTCLYMIAHCSWKTPMLPCVLLQNSYENALFSNSSPDAVRIGLRLPPVFKIEFCSTKSYENM